MWAVMVTYGTVATVFGVSRSERTIRSVFADTVDTLRTTGYAGAVATADPEPGYACLFNSHNEIVATVKIEAVKEY